MPTFAKPFRWLSVLFLIPFGGLAYAAAPKAPQEGLQYQKVAFSLSLGATTFDSLLRSDAAPGVPGTPLSGEGDLGLAKRRLTGTGELTLRMRSRHRIRIGADYLALNRQGTVSFSQPVSFGGSLFRPADRTAAAVNLRRATFTYLYSPVRNERLELSAGLGMELLDFASALSVDARSLVEKVDGTAPLPRVAVEGLWRVAPKWYFEGRVNYLQGTTSKAAVTEKVYDAAAIWAWKPGVAVSLGYQVHDLEADSRFLGAPGRVYFRTSGPRLAVRVGF